MTARLKISDALDLPRARAEPSPFVTAEQQQRQHEQQNQQSTQADLLAAARPATHSEEPQEQHQAPADQRRAHRGHAGGDFQPQQSHLSRLQASSSSSSSSTSSSKPKVHPNPDIAQSAPHATGAARVAVGSASCVIFRRFRTAFTGRQRPSRTASSVSNISTSSTSTVSTNENASTAGATAAAAAATASAGGTSGEPDVVFGAGRSEGAALLVARGDQVFGVQSVHAIVSAHAFERAVGIDPEHDDQPEMVNRFSLSMAGRAASADSVAPLLGRERRRIDDTIGELTIVSGVGDLHDGESGGGSRRPRRIDKPKTAIEVQPAAVAEPVPSLINAPIAVANISTTEQERLLERQRKGAREIYDELPSFLARYGLEPGRRWQLVELLLPGIPRCTTQIVPLAQDASLEPSQDTLTTRRTDVEISIVSMAATEVDGGRPVLAVAWVRRTVVADFGPDSHEAPMRTEVKTDSFLNIYPSSGLPFDTHLSTMFANPYTYQTLALKFVPVTLRSVALRSRENKSHRIPCFMLSGDDRRVHIYERVRVPAPPVAPREDGMPDELGDLQEMDDDCPAVVYRETSTSNHFKHFGELPTPAVDFDVCISKTKTITAVGCACGFVRVVITEVDTNESYVYADTIDGPVSSIRVQRVERRQQSDGGAMSVSVASHDGGQIAMFHPMIAEIKRRIGKSESVAPLAVFAQDDVYVFIGSAVGFVLHAKFTRVQQGSPSVLKPKRAHGEKDAEEGDEKDRALEKGVTRKGSAPAAKLSQGDSKQPREKLGISEEWNCDLRILPLSECFDSITCVQVADIDFDGRNEVLVGTYDRRLLVFNEISSTSTTERPSTGGSDFELTCALRTSEPILKMHWADLSLDGVSELMCVSPFSVFVMQPDLTRARALVTEHMRLLQSVRKMERTKETIAEELSAAQAQENELAKQLSLLSDRRAKHREKVAQRVRELAEHKQPVNNDNDPKCRRSSSARSKDSMCAEASEPGASSTLLASSQSAAEQDPEPMPYVHVSTTDESDHEPNEARGGNAGQDGIRNDVNHFSIHDEQPVHAVNEERDEKDYE